MKCGTTSAGGSTTFVANAWADDLTELRATAGSRLRVEWLQRWWCKKYNRPRKDPLLNEYTLEELMIEYLEDLIELEPQQEFSHEVQTSGRYIQRTGDAIFDKWQEKAALGEKIDFTEAFTTVDMKKTFEAALERSRVRFRERNQITEATAVEPDEIHDNYTGDR